ncbi:MAG: hypothetical protein LBO80_06285 [Treponema sp.]|jgi:hypothetical protein|nr:hypothetical protein [Treponema sp.]
MGLGAAAEKIRSTLGQWKLKAENLPETRRRLAFVCLGGFLGIMLLCLAAVLLLMGPAGGEKTGTVRSLENAFGPMAIPQEELFLPGEPEFLPGLLLERERRETWTAGDGRPYWTDPREDSAPLWRDRLRTEIDALLEDVP